MVAVRAAEVLLDVLGYGRIAAPLAIPAGVFQEVIGRAWHRAVFHRDIAISVDEAPVLCQMLPVGEVDDFQRVVHVGHPADYIQQHLHGFVSV